MADNRQKEMRLKMYERKDRKFVGGGKKSQSLSEHGLYMLQMEVSLSSALFLIGYCFFSRDNFQSVYMFVLRVPPPHNRISNRKYSTCPICKHYSESITAV